MEITNAVLVMVDISGYTQFTKMHTQSLIHAEAIITDLLDAVIDKAEYPLTLSKLEGDAAFLYARLSPGDEAQAARAILNQVDKYFHAFRNKEAELISCDTCVCSACRNIDKLKLKAFFHVGEVLIKQVRQFEEVAGEDVILIHRLMKNSVPSNEYILLTQAFYSLTGGFPGRQVETYDEEAEGLGKISVKVYYPPTDLPPLPLQVRPGPPIPGTPLGDLTARWNKYAKKRLSGELPRPDFKHLPNKDVSRRHWWNYYYFDVIGNIVATIRDRLGLPFQ